MWNTVPYTIRVVMIRPAPTDEIRAIRHALAAKFDNDLDRIVDDLQRQERESAGEYISLQPRGSPDLPHTTSLGASTGEARGTRS
jgi:hypothetical protein